MACLLKKKLPLHILIARVKQSGFKKNSKGALEQNGEPRVSSRVGFGCSKSQPLHILVAMGKAEWF
jgi:hypothetical protein